MKEAQGIIGNVLWRVLWEPSWPWGAVMPDGSLVRAGIWRMRRTIGRRGVVRPWLFILGPLGVAIGLVRRFEIVMTRRQIARRRPARSGGLS